ncbi:MAG: tetratricopeptide repeat protein [Pseudomonadota bacterium]|nr:tetratricopeptide repeat protein [Pseudomonadota bacterium]
MNRILTLCASGAFLVTVLGACAQTPTDPAAPPDTIRICDDTGCSYRPRSGGTFNPNAGVDSEQERRMAALTDMAKADPRAAYDLGLRYYRGDGVEQNSYRAIEFMRSAGERGDVRAQAALGKFYLMGVEEMGSDPAEAEKWLGMAVERGDKESEKLLAEARTAKKNEADLRRWVEAHHAAWRGWWVSGYTYRTYWRDSAWYYY